MALLDWINDATGPVVKGQGVTLRPPRAADHEAWATLRQASYAWLQPWEPLWPSDALSRRDWNRRLSAWNDAWKGGTAYVFGSACICQRLGKMQTDFTRFTTLYDIADGMLECGPPNGRNMEAA